MTLIVETGAASSTAESYESVANSDTYFAARGNATWAALTTAQKEENLRKATEYMSQVYRMRWISGRYTTTQALDWPRAVCYTDAGARTITATEVPVEVRRACMELAVRSSAASLYADQERAVTSETVGPISVDYDVNSSQTKRYPAIDAMLAPLLSGIAGAYQVVRR